MQKIICANWQKVVSYKSLATLDIRALVINAAIALMLFSTMFLNCRGFVESEIASKWYAFTGGSVLLGFGLLVLIKRPKIAIDKISILAAAFIFYLFARILFRKYLLRKIHYFSADRPNRTFSYFRSPHSLQLICRSS